MEDLKHHSVQHLTLYIGLILLIALGLIIGASLLQKGKAQVLHGKTAVRIPADHLRCPEEFLHYTDIFQSRS